MGRRLLFRTLSRQLLQAKRVSHCLQPTYGSWSKSRSYAASSANERGASFGRQNAGGSWRSCCQHIHDRDITSTTAPRYLAPLATVAVGVVSLSAMVGEVW
jgi:hypothetical protein